MSIRMDCSRLDKLKEAYVDNLLPPQVRAGIRSHIEVCELCSRRVSLAAQVKSGMGSAMKHALDARIPTPTAMAAMRAGLEKRLSSPPAVSSRVGSPYFGMALPALLLLVAALAAGIVQSAFVRQLINPEVNIIHVPEIATPYPATPLAPSQASPTVAPLPTDEARIAPDLPPQLSLNPTNVIAAVPSVTADQARPAGQKPATVPPARKPAPPSTRAPREPRANPTLPSGSPEHNLPASPQPAEPQPTALSVPGMGEPAPDAQAQAPTIAAPSTPTEISNPAPSPTSRSMIETPAIAATPTVPSTVTQTHTPVPTLTPTPTPYTRPALETHTPLPAHTATLTAIATPTFTSSPTSTQTSTPTYTPTSTATETPTSTSTPTTTSTVTPTYSPTPSPTRTPTKTPQWTPPPTRTHPPPPPTRTPRPSETSHPHGTWAPHPTHAPTP